MVTLIENSFHGAGDVEVKFQWAGILMKDEVIATVAED